MTATILYILTLHVTLQALNVCGICCTKDIEPEGKDSVRGGTGLLGEELRDGIVTVCK